MAEDKPGSDPGEKVALQDIKARLAGEDPPKEPEEKPPEKEAEPPPPPEEEPESDIEEVLKQADKPDAVRNAIAMEKERVRKMRERAEAAELQVKEYEDRDKTEEQKREEKELALRKENDELKARVMRREVADAVGLEPRLAERLRGNTKEELEEDAERLLDLVKPKTPTGDPDAGKGAAPPEKVDMNDILRKKARVG